METLIKLRQNKGRGRKKPGKSSKPEDAQPSKTKGQQQSKSKDSKTPASKGSQASKPQAPSPPKNQPEQPPHTPTQEPQPNAPPAPRIKPPQNKADTLAFLGTSIYYRHLRPSFAKTALPLTDTHISGRPTDLDPKRAEYDTFWCERAFGELLDAFTQQTPRLPAFDADRSRLIISEDVSYRSMLELVFQEMHGVLLYPAPEGAGSGSVPDRSSTGDGLGDGTGSRDTAGSISVPGDNTSSTTDAKPHAKYRGQTCSCGRHPGYWIEAGRYPGIRDLSDEERAEAERRDEKRVMGAKMREKMKRYLTEEVEKQYAEEKKYADEQKRVEEQRAAEEQKRTEEKKAAALAKAVEMARQTKAVSEMRKWKTAVAVRAAESVERKMQKVVEGEDDASIGSEPGDEGELMLWEMEDV